ncbi:MAG: sigma-70 family RNA polymerase sigma factor [Gammaproteobacteria bacterium]
MTDPKQLIKDYCRESDHGAFSAFYRQQAPRLWRFLVARGCSQDAAYDLLSEAFARFIQVVCKDPRAPVALLYRIAVNAHIDSYRRQTASPVHFDSDAVDAATELSVEASDEHEYLRTVIGTLDEKEQNLLLMRYWIGLTHREVAEVLGLPPGTVRRQCAAAVKKLRQRWQDEQ